MATDGFVERARRELSAEELSGLRVFHAETEKGSVVFMPIIRKMSQQVQWTANAKGTIRTQPTSVDIAGQVLCDSGMHGAAGTAN